MAIAAVSRAADQAAHLRLLAEARGAAAWTEASLIDQAVARADAERATLAAAKLERTVIYAVARAEFDSAGAGSVGEAAYEAAIRAAAVSRIPVLLRAAGTPVSTRALAARARHAAPTVGASPLAVAALAMAGGTSGDLVHPSAFCGAVVDAGDDCFVVTDGGNLTGGRARHRGSLLRAAGLPVPVPLFTQAEREVRVARRAAVIRERRAKRVDMVGLRALLLHLGVESQAVLAEVHGDEWRPHRWAHWIFPCSAAVEEEPASCLTLRTADAFVQADSFAWREVVERIVGKAESTAGGLHAYFSPFALARIDCFVSTLSQVKRRPVWLLRLLQRLRRLRTMLVSDLALGPMPRALSRPSKRGRAGLRRALFLSTEAFRLGSLDVGGGGSPVVSVSGAGSVVVEGVAPLRVGSGAAVVQGGVSPSSPLVVAATSSRPVRREGLSTSVPKRAPYLARRPGNSAIGALLARGAALQLPAVLARAGSGLV